MGTLANLGMTGAVVVKLFTSGRTLSGDEVLGETPACRADGVFYTELLSFKRSGEKEPGLVHLTESPALPQATSGISGL